MDGTKASTSPSAAQVSARVVGLLALAMFINYADRGSLSVAAPVLRGQLGIGDGGMGVLLSAFFWSYTAAQPLAGSLVQRFDVRKVLAVGLGLWALATMLCGLVTGFVAILALRLLIGLGESVIYPANARILAEQAPERVRGRCNGLISMGMCLGPTAGTLAGGLILAHWGWRAVFVSLGAVSLLWLIPWLRTPMPAAPRAASGMRRNGPGYGELLRQRALWGASVGQFCYSWQFYLLLTWLPSYLVKAQHFSLSLMAVVGAAVYGVQSLAALLSGVFTDRMIRRGGSSAGVRRTVVLAGVGLGGAALLTIGIGPHVLALPGLFAAGICTGMANPMIFSIGQTLSGPAAGGRWMGIQNMLGNCAGICAPIATGLIVAATGSFTGAFVLAAVLSVLGLVCWGVVLARVEPVTWRTSSLAPGAPA